jgi:hypothetical protein
MDLVKQMSYSISYAKTIAVVSLIIGLTIFAIYYFFPNAPLILEFGLMYLFFVTIINLALVLRLLYYWRKQPDTRKKISKLILLVIINIPIAIVITSLAFKTFVNNMD